jgi:hypothetical protein
VLIDEQRLRSGRRQQIISELFKFGRPIRIVRFNSCRRRVGLAEKRGRKARVSAAREVAAS